MSDQFSFTSARIRALKTSMVSLLEGTRTEGISTDRLRQTKALLVEEYQKFLNEGAKRLLKEDFVGSDEIIQCVEDAYAAWREIDTAFRETFALAYDGAIPRQNLLADDTHLELRQRIGDPIAALYNRLYSLWTDHLDGRPWDAHLAENLTHADTDQLDNNLHSLVHGDHLDVEDALSTLTGPLRYAFAHYLKRQKEPLEMLEESLWMRPEIIVINDYWQYHPQVRLLDLLRRTSRPKYSGVFAKIQDFFADDSSTATNGAAERIVENVRQSPPDEKDTYMRCLMLHPNTEIRRYAVTNVNPDGFWKVVTPEAVPLATILSMLEKVVGSNQYDEDFQKVFFHAVHRRLLSAASRSEILYARGIVRILARLPFFVEDHYFEKLMNVADYLTAKEKQYHIGDGLLDGYITTLRKEKDKTGTLETHSPGFTSIPAVVLRKLARDGHFWFELSMHPMFKIARETIHHINSPDRALRIAHNHGTNQDVLRTIGKNRGLFNTRTAKLALLTNPRTPPTVSFNYLLDLSQQDKESLLRRSTVHPEIRQQLRDRLRV